MHIRTFHHLAKFPLVLLLFITLFGFFVRAIYLDSIPTELHRDEAAIAFNARMLTELGFDEHGQAYPLVFKSFGDYKLPVMVYVTMVSMMFGGINEWAIRLPTVIFATLLIPTVYFLTKELFGGRRLPLLSAALVSMSVWHVVLSRTVYEPIVGLTFSTIGLVTLLRARQNPAWLYFSACMFFVGCFTYNLPMLLMPLMIFVTFLLYRKEYQNIFLSSWAAKIGFLAVLCAFVIPLYVTQDLVQGKSGVTLFNEAAMLHESNRDFDALIRQGVSYKISYLSTVGVIKIFENIVAGYLAVWNPVYLFVKGNSNPWHSLQLISMGQFQWGMILFLGIGLLTLGKKIPRLSKAELFVIAYLLLSPIPNALTVNSPTTNRLMDFHLALTLVMAIGLSVLVSHWKRSTWKAQLLTIIVVGYSIFSWGHSYYKYLYLSPFNMDLKWNEGIAEVAVLTKEMGQSIDRMYIDASYLPDYFLLYAHFGVFGNLSPEEFRNSVEWGDHHAFLSPDSYGRYSNILPFSLDKFTQSNYGEYFPDGVNEVLFIRRLWPSDPVGVYPGVVVYDASGKPIWELTRLSREQVLDTLKQE